jgi:hypothetical protein
MTAKFIKNNDIDYLCNICSEIISVDNAIGLKCDPEKHIFCYECILNWFKEVNHTKNSSNYTIKNMCPICRKNGGLLPVHSEFSFNKGINYIKIDKDSLFINPDKLENECGVKLKTKLGFCKSIGKELYDGFCGVHYNANIK